MNLPTGKLEQCSKARERWAPWLILGILFLLLSLGLSNLLYRELSFTFSSQWKTGLEATSQDRARGLQTYFEEEHRQLKVLAHYPTLLAVLGHPVPGPPSFPIAQGPVTHLHELLASASSYNNYRGVWVLDAKGQTVLSESTHAPLPPTVSQWACDSEGYCLKFATHQGIDRLFLREKVMAEGRQIGSIVIAKRLDRIQNLLENFATQGTSVDVVFARLEEQRLVPLYPLNRSAPSLPSSVLTDHQFQSKEGTHFDLAVSRIAESPYYVLCMLDSDKLNYQRDKFLAALSFVGVCLALGLSILHYGYHKQERMVDYLHRLKAESRLGSLMASAPDPILFMDTDDKILFHNARAEALLGYTAEEMRQLTFEQLQAQGLPLSELTRASATPLQVTELRTKQGDLVTVELHARALDTGGEKNTLVVARDLTERLKAQAVIERTRQRLSEVQKMEAVGRLAGGIAHDFNNLLTVIGGYAESVRELPGEDGVAEELTHAVSRAKDLTSQLLTFSRKKTTQPQTFELKALLEKNLGLVKRLLPTDANLDWRLCSEPLWVHLNPGQAEQILINLVINARDAGQGSGRVEVRLGSQTLQDSLEWAGGQLPPGSYSVLRVEDDGCGMDEATLRQIFEPFFTTKPEGRGTGLGLSTIFGIVQEAGGGVVVESRPGEGTSFEVFLPLQEAPVTSNKEAHEARAPGTGPCRIALAEDEPALRKLLLRTLSRAGFEVEVAENGREAVSRFEPRANQYDLLITDIVMPGLRGPEVAKALCSANPNLKVIFMSGYGDGALNQVRQLGGQFLQKPFSPIALVEIIKSLAPASLTLT